MRTGLAKLALLAATFPCAVFAVDGVVLLDHAKALAGNITPGDAPGYPITISQPGSYRLDGNLIVPDVNTDGIDITADNVTIDLNGFSIIGPNVCTIRVTFGIPGLTCTPGGSTGRGTGILGHNGTMIRNGTIRGMGAVGISLSTGVIEDIHSSSNGGYGILVDGPAIVKNCTVELNLTGLGMGTGLATNIVAANNQYIGVVLSLGRLLGSTVINNGTGLYSPAISGGAAVFSRSFFGGNQQDFGPSSSPPLNAGENICGGVPCPGFYGTVQ